MDVKHSVVSPGSLNLFWDSCWFTFY